MEVVVDTSAIVAVLLGEPHRAALLRATTSVDLVAPPSIHWEVGNAFSAMFKKRRLSFGTARRAIQAYHRIPIRFSDVDLDAALEVAEDLHLCAYDAYVIVCALQHHCSVLSLDEELIGAAAKVGVKALEIG